MKTKSAVGVVIFALGVALVAIAYRSTEAPLEELSSTITGRYSDRTMWSFAAGIAAIVGGGLLTMLGSRR